MKIIKRKTKKIEREQPHQKINPPMITSAKNYTKNTNKETNQKNKKTDRQNPRTNGRSKAIQMKSHKEA